MTKAAARTAAGPMTLVAIEQYFPSEQRIISDELALQILPFTERAFAWLMRPRWARDWMVRATEKTLPGIWPGMMCRKRYIDEKLLESLAQVEGVVNLGAGFDTRAYRMPELRSLPVWEIDQPVTIEPKRRRLRALFAEVPAHARLVPIDFDQEGLGVVLEKHGYSEDKRTFFIWEAVTQYLTEPGIRSTFSFLARAAPGSRLVLTYVLKAFIAGEVMYPGHERIYTQYVLKDKIWLFGMAPESVADFLGEYGWHVIEHVGYAELAERYVRSTGRDFPSMPIERLVYAEKL